MKHVSNPRAGERLAGPRPPSLRMLAKRQTRAKLLATARRLFSEHGYERATIRDIAAEAGMSTGAVFANFADKAHLFREIMVADMESLADAMHGAAARTRTVDDAILRAFSAGYAFCANRLPLVRAAFSISWSSEQGMALCALPPMQSLRKIISDQLQFGVERGELVREAEIKLRTQMLLDAYLANYPEAILQGWGLAALQARARDQIRVILAGARHGSRSRFQRL